VLSSHPSRPERCRRRRSRERKSDEQALALCGNDLEAEHLRGRLAALGRRQQP
jgi:hypothetical protein